MKKTLVLMLFAAYSRLLYCCDPLLERLFLHVTGNTESDRAAIRQFLDITDDFNAVHKTDIGTPFKAFSMKTDGDDGIDHILITDDDKKKLLGCVTYIFFTESISRWNTYPAHIYISGLKVDKELRGKKLGSALFSYVRDKKYQETPAYIRLTASPSDYQHEKISYYDVQERLRNFYKKQGMQEVEFSRNFILYLDKQRPQT